MALGDSTTYISRTITDPQETRSEQPRKTRAARHTKVEAIRISTSNLDICNLLRCITSVIEKAPKGYFGYRVNDADSNVEILMPWFKGHSPVIVQMPAMDLIGKYPGFNNKNLAEASGNVLVFEINPHDNPEANNVVLNMSNRMRKLTFVNPYKCGFMTKGNGCRYQKGDFGCTGKKIVVAIAIDQ